MGSGLMIAIGLAIGLVIGVLVGGLAVWLRVRKRLIPRPITGAAFRVLLKGVPLYEGDDLHEAKSIRTAYRQRGNDAVLEAWGELRG